MTMSDRPLVARVRHCRHRRIHRQPRAAPVQYLRGKCTSILFRQLVGILVHNDGHTTQTETVRLWHHSLSEPVGHMVRTKEGGDNAEELEGYESKGNGVPTPEDQSFELDIRTLASREKTSRIASLANSRLHKWREVATTPKLILDAQTPVNAENSRPLGVNLPFQVERSLSVSYVTWCDQECKRDPEKEGVNRKECTIVKKDAGPANEGCNNTKARSQKGESKFHRVTHSNNVGVVPDIEKREQAEYEGDEGVDGEKGV